MGRASPPNDSRTNSGSGAIRQQPVPEDVLEERFAGTAAGAKMKISGNRDFELVESGLCK